MTPFDLASVIIIGQAGLAVLLVVDTHRHAKCRWCEHCRRAEADLQEKRARKRHEAFHAFTDRNARACSDPKCDGRR